ncbi:MAG: hypothetical protein ACRCX2_03255 [Paraclostridium sp.]
MAGKLNFLLIVCISSSKNLFFEYSKLSLNYKCKNKFELNDSYKKGDFMNERFYSRRYFTCGACKKRYLRRLRCRRCRHCFSCCKCSKGFRAED